MVLAAPHFATVIQMQVIVTKDITLECKVGIMFVDMLIYFFADMHKNCVSQALMCIPIAGGILLKYRSGVEPEICIFTCSQVTPMLLVCGLHFEWQALRK